MQSRVLLHKPGTNPVQLTRGMEKTVAALVKELKNLSTEVKDDATLASVASVSAGNNADIGKLIADAMAKVGVTRVALGLGTCCHLSGDR